MLKFAMLLFCYLEIGNKHKCTEIMAHCRFYGNVWE